MALVNNLDGRFFFFQVRRCLLNKNGNLLKPCTPPTITLCKMFPKVAKHEHQCRTGRSSSFFCCHTRSYFFSNTTQTCVTASKVHFMGRILNLLKNFSVSQGNFFPCSVLSSKTTYICSVISYYSSSKIHFIGKFCSLYASWLVWQIFVVNSSLHIKTSFLQMFSINQEEIFPMISRVLKNNLPIVGQLSDNHPRWPRNESHLNTSPKNGISSCFGFFVLVNFPFTRPQNPSTTRTL